MKGAIIVKMITNTMKIYLVKKSQQHYQAESMIFFLLDAEQF